MANNGGAKQPLDSKRARGGGTTGPGEQQHDPRQEDGAHDSPIGPPDAEQVEALERRMARPTPADLFVLAGIAEVLDDPDLARRWRWQAGQAMRPLELRADLASNPTTACALIADLSARTGSLEGAYRLLGPDPAPPPADGGEADRMFEPPGDPRRWAR